MTKSHYCIKMNTFSISKSLAENDKITLQLCQHSWTYETQVADVNDCNSENLLNDQQKKHVVLITVMNKVIKYSIY